MSERGMQTGGREGEGERGRKGRGREECMQAGEGHKSSMARVITSTTACTIYTYSPYVAYATYLPNQRTSVRSYGYFKDNLDVACK